MPPHRTPHGRLPPASALLAALVLTACNAADPSEAPDASAPTGTTEASLDGTTFGGGPLTVANGDDFYLRVTASDDAGVSAVVAALRPGGTDGAYQPLGTEAVLGFTVAGPTCEPGLTTNPTGPVACVFVVTASDAAHQPHELRGEASDGRNVAGLAPLEVTVATRGTWYRDADGDGFGTSLDPVEAFEPPEGYVAQPGDCDDDASTTHPGATEVGDTVDNDCDGEVDEGTTTTYYADADGDAYGDPASPAEAIEPPSGYVLDATDCDDSRNDVHPGAPEQSDGVDNDCDAMVDEEVFYRDADADTYGSNDGAVEAEHQPAGYVSDDSDCDDSRSTVHPGALEVPGDGIDNDCDGTVDEAL